MTLAATPSKVSGDAPSTSRCSAVALAAALLGFFVITFDAVVVNVALPSIRDDLGGGMSGLQWVVDGYTLMFAGIAVANVCLVLVASAALSRGRQRKAGLPLPQP